MTALSPALTSSGQALGRGLTGRDFSQAGPMGTLLSAGGRRPALPANSSPVRTPPKYPVTQITRQALRNRSLGGGGGTDVQAPVLCGACPEAAPRCGHPRGPSVPLPAAREGRFNPDFPAGVTAWPCVLSPVFCPPLGSTSTPLPVAGPPGPLGPWLPSESWVQPAPISAGGQEPGGRHGVLAWSGSWGPGGWSKVSMSIGVHPVSPSASGPHPPGSLSSPQ